MRCEHFRMVPCVSEEDKLDKYEVFRMMSWNYLRRARDRMETEIKDSSEQQPPSLGPSKGANPPLQLTIVETRHATGPATNGNDFSWTLADV